MLRIEYQPAHKKFANATDNSHWLETDPFIIV